MNVDHFAELWRSERYDALTVCHVTWALALAAGGNKGRVTISLETIAKQRAHHPELTMEEHLALPRILLDGEWRRDPQGGAIVLYEDPSGRGNHARAFVKVTAKRELYLVSLCRLNEGKLRQLRRRGHEVIKPHD